ncbi:MAG TPA: sigma-70 family RNA polymerase sigma factor [Rhodocyclaceae bacterium]|nr:sigma-70 family RNA polymerase sigma factor [Rhodocyclaceae bacterium]
MAEISEPMLAHLRHKHFEQVVRAYSGELYRFAYWMCRDRFVAEDLVQETFMRAWNKWDNLRDRDNPKPWLLTILRNEHARLYERKQFDYVDEAPEDLDIAADHQPIELLELENLVGSLSLSLREPFLLQTLGGFSCAEIAEQLGTTEGAIMVRLTRARQTLRSTLEGANSSQARKSS